MSVGGRWSVVDSSVDFAPQKSEDKVRATSNERSPTDFCKKNILREKKRRTQRAPPCPGIMLAVNSAWRSFNENCAKIG